PDGNENSLKPRQATFRRVECAQSQSNCLECFRFLIPAIPCLRRFEWQSSRYEPQESTHQQLTRSNSVAVLPSLLDRFLFLDQCCDFAKIIHNGLELCDGFAGEILRLGQFIAVFE